MSQPLSPQSGNVAQGFVLEFCLRFSSCCTFLIEKNMEKVLESKVSVMGCGRGESLLLG